MERKVFTAINTTSIASTLKMLARSVSIQSNIELDLRMKEFNDKKQFKNALSLFNMQKQHEMSDFAINQALQACVHLRDFQRGSAIHRQLSSGSSKCPYIQTSLVQLYSEFVFFFSRKMREH